MLDWCCCCCWLDASSGTRVITDRLTTLRSLAPWRTDALTVWVAMSKRRMCYTTTFDMFGMMMKQEQTGQELIIKIASRCEGEPNKCVKVVDLSLPMHHGVSE